MCVVDKSQKYYTTKEEKCKCCNPDVNNPNSTKICDSCKQLFIKFQYLQDSIDEVTNSSYLYGLKHQNIKSDVYKININKISDLNILRKKRKKFLNNTIQKAMNEIAEAKIKADNIAKETEDDNYKDHTDYTKTMNIAKDLKVVISDIFDN